MSHFVSQCFASLVVYSLTVRGGPKNGGSPSHQRFQYSNGPMIYLDDLGVPPWLPCYPEQPWQGRFLGSRLALVLRETSGLWETQLAVLGDQRKQKGCFRTIFLGMLRHLSSMCLIVFKVVHHFCMCFHYHSMVFHLFLYGFPPFSGDHSASFWPARSGPVQTGGPTTERRREGSKARSRARRSAPWRTWIQNI